MGKHRKRSKESVKRRSKRRKQIKLERNLDNKNINFNSDDSLCSSAFSEDINVHKPALQAEPCTSPDLFNDTSERVNSQISSDPFSDLDSDSVCSIKPSTSSKIKQVNSVQRYLDKDLNDPLAVGFQLWKKIEFMKVNLEKKINYNRLGRKYTF